MSACLVNILARRESAFSLPVMQDIDIQYIVSDSEESLVIFELSSLSTSVKSHCAMKQQLIKALLMPLCATYSQNWECVETYIMAGLWN